MAVAALLLLSACITAVQCQKQYSPMSFRQWMDAKNGEAKVDSYKDYEESELQGMAPPAYRLFSTLKHTA
jgi:hypothetical protein